MPANSPREARASRSRTGRDAPRPRIRTANDPFSRGQQRQAKIERIVTVAAALIQRRGVAGTSLDDVADALGVTKPSVYYYVKSKDDLVRLCHLRIAAHQRRAVDLALACPDDGMHRVRTFIEAYAAFVWGEDSGLPRLWQDGSLGEAHRKEVNRAYFRESERLVAIIAEAARDGSIRAHDPLVVERALVSSILWVPIWFNERRARYDKRLILDEILDLFMHGLLPGDRTTRSRSLRRRGGA